MNHDANAGNSQEPDEVARFLVELRALGDGPAPAPAPAVAALIGGAVPLRSHSLRRTAARAALVAAAVLAALVAAAANHSLPQPAQRVVSNVVNNLTPFDIDPNHAPTTPTPPPPKPTDTREREHENTGTEERPGRPGESESEPARGDDTSSESGAQSWQEPAAAGHDS